MSTHLSTTTRCLPSGAAQRVSLLCDAARSDEALGLLQSAETNLRLALCFAPGDEHATTALTRVLAARESQRRAAVP